MKYGGTLLAVKDMEAAKRFYRDLLGLHVVFDLGANVTMGHAGPEEGGISLQTMETWTEFIDTPAAGVHFGGRAGELVYEEEDIEAFERKLAAWPGVELVHPMKTHPWGQRVIRLYDPDGHIVEVGEDMKVVVKRFIRQGMSDEEVAQKSMFPLPFVAMCRAEMEEEG